MDAQCAVTKNENGLTLHSGWDELPIGTKLYTHPQQGPAEDPNASIEALAIQLAAMIVTWVDGSAKMGTDWRPALASIIQYRLNRYTALLQQEPLDFVSLLNEAEEIVRGSPLWKRFIDGTPLSNDIAVWMAEFAQSVACRTSPQRK